MGGCVMRYWKLQHNTKTGPQYTGSHIRLFVFFVGKFGAITIRITN